MPEGITGSIVQFSTVPVPDACLAASPVGTDVGLFIVPKGANYRVELLSAHLKANVLAIDATDAITADLEFCDDSAAGAVSNLNSAAINITAAGGLTVLVGNQIWRGAQIMDPGDTLNLELTRVTPDTAGQGYAVTLEYCVLSGGYG